MGKFESTAFINFNVSTLSYSTFVNRIINVGVNSIVYVANVHMFIETQKDTEFLQVVNNADIVTPDGKPLCLALKWLYGIKQERVAGMDLLPSLLIEAENQGIQVGFYGYTKEGLMAVKLKCNELYPSLKPPLFISPPFRPLTEVEQQTYVNQVNEAKVQILFVALGCPKQEKWMASMKGRINATMIGIGGALPVFAGLQKRAPKWMQKFSLEWLFRLVQEPKRLFKRYLITNTYFIYLIMKEKVRLVFSEPNLNNKISKRKLNY